MSTELAILDANQMQTAIEYAERLSYSGMIPDTYQGKPANILWAMEYGRTLGLSTVATINGVNVIKGKPTASAGLISALVRQAGHKMRIGYDAATMTGWATIVRADDPDFTFRSEWTLVRAVEAELCEIKDGKPFAVDKQGKTLPWKKFYPAMVKARATTEVARDACEEILFGLHYTPEELGATVDEDGAVITVQQDPQPQFAVADAVVRKEQADRAAHPAASEPQRTKLILLMRDKFGLEGEKDRGKRLAMMSKHLGREIATFKDITAVEAHATIEALSGLADHIADAETVPDPEMPQAAPEPAAPEPQDGQDFHLAPSVGPAGVCADLAASMESAADEAELQAIGERVKELADKGVLHGEHLTQLDGAWRERSEKLRGGWSHRALAEQGAAL